MSEQIKKNVGRCIVENFCPAFIVVNNDDQSMHRVYLTPTLDLTLDISQAARFSDAMSATMFLNQAPIDLNRVFEGYKIYTLIPNSRHFVKIELNYGHRFKDNGELELYWYIIHADDSFYGANGEVLKRIIEHRTISLWEDKPKEEQK